jgi:hypothetical protein
VCPAWCHQDNRKAGGLVRRFEGYVYCVSETIRDGATPIRADVKTTLRVTRRMGYGGRTRQEYRTTKRGPHLGTPCELTLEVSMTADKRNCPVADMKTARHDSACLAASRG